VLSGCHSMYTSRTIKLEIVVPAAAYFPDKYDKLAIRYNNANIRYNPVSSKYYFGTKEITDETNLDSIASLVYYDAFVNELKNQILFDSIVEIEIGKNENINWLENHEVKESTHPDSIGTDEFTAKYAVSKLKSYLSLNKLENDSLFESKYIDPKLGLYTTEDLVEIRKSTNADVFLSLDIYESTDGILINNGSPTEEVVYVLGFWNFFDLHNSELKYFYDRIDTISWHKTAFSMYQNPQNIPPRKQAVLNAANVAGSRFAEFLVPHWIEVDRMYYKSGPGEMRRATKLMKDNEWMDAAEIWKKNTKHKNKFIAAKSMYNLGLANEMQGNMDASIDWVVKSYHHLGSKYVPHPNNCLNYIQLLALRKQDFKRIEYQLNEKKSE